MTTFPSNSISIQRTARVIGATYLVTDATSIYAIFVRSSLVVSGDVARTATNIAAHAQLFRAGIVADVITGAGVVILNLALYTLLSSVNRNLARLALMWRLIEVAVGSAIAVCSFVALSLVTDPNYLQAYQPREIQALVSLFVGAQVSGYLIVLLFVGLGSTTYMYLLLKSRYVPKALALLGLVGSALVGLFALIRMWFPAFVAAAVPVVQALPLGARALLAVIVVPILAFEIIIGLWLLVKGVRIPEQT